MRLIDADALAEDLLYDAELCSRALDDTDIVGKERERLQWEKDCKQNCVFYMTKSPTIDAVQVVRCKDCKHRLNKGTANNICGLDVPIFDIYGFCSEGERKDDE